MNLTSMKPSLKFLNIFFLLIFELAGRQPFQNMDKGHVCDFNISNPFSTTINNYWVEEISSGENWKPWWCTMGGTAKSAPQIPLAENSTLISTGKSGLIWCSPLCPRKPSEFLKLYEKNALWHRHLLPPLPTKPEVCLPEFAWHLRWGFPESRGAMTGSQNPPALEWYKLRVAP